MNADESKRTKASMIIDLSHPIDQQMSMFPGLPAPEIIEFASREQCASRYSGDTSFVIHRYELMANTGTYLDAPLHRFSNGSDLATLPLEKMVNRPIVRLDVRAQVKKNQRSIDESMLGALHIEGCALLVWTGWDNRWNRLSYLDRCPYLTETAAKVLVDRRVALVGIDSWNVDDTKDGFRPVHTALLRAEIPIIENMCNMQRLPETNARLHAAPLPIRGGSSVPVRAYAFCDD